MKSYTNYTKKVTKLNSLHLYLLDPPSSGAYFCFWFWVHVPPLPFLPLLFSVPDMTYNVFGGTLNLAQSSNPPSLPLELGPIPLKSS